MKLIILSTETKHHIYFINKVYKEFDISGIIYERRVLSRGNVNGAFYDREQDQYEEFFFDKTNGGVDRILAKELEKKVVIVDNVNKKEVESCLDSLKPDLIIVFGTGIIHPHLINIPKWGMVNLHGGFTQYYRGLDSTLWTLYHKDFDKLGVTIHYVEPEVDTGSILLQERIIIEKLDQIYHFRYKITKKVTLMMLELLAAFNKCKGCLPATPMQPKGKYFSAMETEKKYVALRNLEDYQMSL